MKDSYLNTYDGDTVKILAGENTIKTLEDENTIKFLEDKKAKI
jgi:hypothetical protein